MSRTYLDWNATTPLRPQAREAMLATLDLLGNPSSVYAEGRAARRIVEDARAAIEAAVGAEPRTTVFTSGSTEANVLALSPGLHSDGGVPLENVLVSAIEHSSVLAGGRFPGKRLGFIPVTADGVIDLDGLRDLLAKGPALVSVMLANNETGAIQPIRAVADVVHQAGGLLHVDAVQAFGKIDFKISELQADLLSVSAHKLGGPKGVGALVVGSHVKGYTPLLRGGGQERGQRAGTENLIGIAGFGAAVGAAMAVLDEDATAMANLRHRLEGGLKQDPEVAIFSERVPRLPNTTLFARRGLRAETGVIAFDLEGVAVSSGSACSSGKVQPSHVLEAMGVDPALVGGAIRVSLGWDTTEADIERLLAAWRKIAGALGREEPRNGARTVLKNG